MNIQAVIFDRDNTLVRFNHEAIVNLQARIAEIVPELPPNTAEIHWATWPGPWPRFEHEEPEFWRLFWSDLCTHYQIAPAAAQELQQIGPFYHTCFIAFPDAVPCLQALRTRNIQLAMLTNFELPSIHLTLTSAGIDPTWFSALLSSTMLGVYKPDPRAYLAITDALQLPPNNCMFVDDLLINVEAACALGMHGYLIDRIHANVLGTTARIKDLTSLPELIPALDRRPVSGSTSSTAYACPTVRAEDS